MNRFATNLKALREHRGTLQKDIAKLLDVTIRQYQRYETGASEPNIDAIIFLCRFFEVSADYLLGLSDDPARR